MNFLQRRNKFRTELATGILAARFWNRSVAFLSISEPCGYKFSILVNIKLDGAIQIKLTSL